MSRYPWRDTSEDIAGQSGSQWETPSGAQVKADKAEENAEKYSDEKLADHVAHGTHPAENIVESPLKRFASDDRMAFWDNKADGTLATQATKGMMSPEDKAKLDKSTNGMTPDTLMLRDAGGRAKVAAPSAANDIARKQEVDEVQANLNLHTGNADIHTSAAEHTKLAGIQAGAEVNQPAFSQVNDIQAGSKSDGLTVKGGTGITVTTNPISKELQITATGSATPGAHASSHITGGTDVIPNAVIDGNSGLMSGADAAFVRRDGETKSGSQVKADAARDTAKAYADQQISKLTPASIGAETPSGAQAKVDALAGSGNTKTVKQVDDAVIAHLADYVRQPAYSTTSGTATAYTVTLDPAPGTISEGFGITIVPHIDCGANPTLKIGSLSAVALKDQKGNTYAAGKLLAGKPYTFRKVGTDFLADSGSGGGEAPPTGSQVYNSPGTFSFTVPDGVYQIRAELWGAGGGGGKGLSAGANFPGAGGGGGAYSFTILNVTPGQILPIIVGAGGAGSAATGGTAVSGGDSSVGTITAKGGSGGQSTVSGGGTAPTPGVGGAVTTDVLLSHKGGTAPGGSSVGPGGGSAGAGSDATGATAGSAGASGGLSAGTNGASRDQAGVSPGGGGGGGNSTGSLPGQKGGDGKVILNW